MSHLAGCCAQQRRLRNHRGFLRSQMLSKQALHGPKVLKSSHWEMCSSNSTQSAAIQDLTSEGDIKSCLRSLSGQLGNLICSKLGSSPPGSTACRPTPARLSGMPGLRGRETQRQSSQEDCCRKLQVPPVARGVSGDSSNPDAGDPA